MRIAPPVHTRQEVSTALRLRTVRLFMVLKKQNNRKREHKKAPTGTPM
jgi:hypothetical protein